MIRQFDDASKRIQAKTRDPLTFLELLVHKYIVNRKVEDFDLLLDLFKDDLSISSSDGTNPIITADLLNVFHDEPGTQQTRVPPPNPGDEVQDANMTKEERAYTKKKNKAKKLTKFKETKWPLV